MLSIFGKNGREVFTNLELPIESVLLYGKGSGKDLLASYGISYVTYLVNLLKDAQAYFGLADGENIDIVNIATNSRQANNAFFAKLKSRIKSPCFMKFAPKINSGIIEFPNMLRLHSLHNESWEGLNILAWVMDEASAFRTAGGDDNADRVYNTLRTSANSRFPSGEIEEGGRVTKRWIGIVISFARRQEGDFTIEKYEEALTDPRIFADKGSTFEINPQYDKDHPLYRGFKWVTIEELNVRVPSPSWRSSSRTRPTAGRSTCASRRRRRTASSRSPRSWMNQSTARCTFLQ